MVAIMFIILLGLMVLVPAMILVALKRYMGSRCMVLKKVIILLVWGFLILFLILVVLYFMTRMLYFLAS